MSHHPHPTHTWTAGAQRVWQAAQALAAAQAAKTLAVEHILWGLLTIESRAAEQLERVGATLAELPVPWQAASGTETTDERLASTDPLPLHDLVEAVLIEAKAEMLRQVGGDELATEHLLAGLRQVPSDVSKWLSQFGLHSSGDAAKRSSVATRDGSDVPANVPQELQLTVRNAANIDRLDAYRILDAAGNRAREGLRVVEDFVRWTWNEEFLSRQLKECRHELAAILRSLPQPMLIAARDTQHDVGTEIRTASEYLRESPRDVATASLKRVQEALRSLEEFCKVVDAELSPRFEQLRYRIYTIEKSIHSIHAARLRFADAPVCLLATSALCHHGIGPAILGALQAGVKLIQLREKSLPDRELIELAQYVRRWTKDAEAIFIVNDRPDLAALVDADGVHLGQDDLPVAAARKILGPEKLVGVSTHSIEQARQAVLDGADYLGVGPCFPSSTKSFETFPGLAFVRQVATEISLPWYAIGGINAENIPDLRAAGATRIAVSGAICASEDPGWSARELVFRLNG